MWRLTARTILLALCLATPSLAQTQRTGSDSAWTITDTTETQQVLFTISGGISLGSYQSGVNWALVRFIRIAHNNPKYRQDRFLPDLRFAAMAGASAGNINALMSAIAWCTEQPGEAPENSIFWKTWVYTGWEELYPEHRSESGGVFDRTYYRTGPLEWLKQQMTRNHYPSDCHIPLGMTMTRVEPTTTVLTNNVTASTQRYATLLRVETSRRDSTRLEFTQPAPRLFHKSLGELASLAVAAGDTIPADQVLKALMASSAFPVAFADVSLSYVPGDKIASGSACATTEEVCGDWTTAQFIDGGVFDNNPLALALGLFRLDDPGRQLPGHEIRPSIVYINPSALRDPLKSARMARTAVSAPAPGLASFLKVLKGAIPSARQYELQSMARTLADPTTNEKINPYISTTDRAYPIVSEHLGAFAGFLGRPFREYDYYAGVYDALHYISEHILCSDDRRWKASSRDSLVTCTRKELQTMMRDTKRFGFGPIPRAVLQDLYRTEFTSPPWLSATTSATGDTAARIRVLHQLVVANEGEASTHTDCLDGDFLDRLLCSDGFGGMVDRFATDDSIPTIIKRWASDSTCRSSPLDGRANCLADGTMQELVERGPRAFAGRRMNDVFQQLHSDTTQGTATRGMLSGVEYYFRGIDDEYAPAWLPDPSTVTQYARTRWHLYPYRFTVVMGDALTGPELSYLPSFRVARGIRVIAPLAMVLSRAPTPLGDSRLHFFGDPGLGLAYKIGKPWAHDLSIDWRAIMPLNNIKRPGLDDIGWRFLYQPIGGKVSFGFGQAPKQLAGPNGRRKLFSIGVGDVNGLLYYLFRK